jgi:ligand-binding SRPBCC domain-containing protein
LLPVSQEAAFAFHLDPRNLRRINPPGVEVVDLRLPARMEVGAELHVSVRLFRLLRQEWQVMIAEITPPHRMVDVAIRGPFAAWLHQHEFREVPGGTEMIDRIEYRPPLGRFGRWLNPVFFRPQLRAMFIWRHCRTRELLRDAGR